MKKKVQADWESQKLFLKELADINGIEFNPDKFPDQTIKRGLFKKGYLQSDAALYIGEQIGLLKQQGKRIFYPWNTADLICNFNGGIYSLKPWLYVPTVATPKYVNDKNLIKAVSFNKQGGPEKYLSDDADRIGVMLICKGCLHEWKHRCGGPGFAGLAPINPDDVIETKADDGSVLKVFRCPVCGSLEIFSNGEFHWD